MNYRRLVLLSAVLVIVLATALVFSTQEAARFVLTGLGALITSLP